MSKAKPQNDHKFNFKVTYDSGKSRIVRNYRASYVEYDHKHDADAQRTYGKITNVELLG